MDTYLHCGSVSTVAYETVQMGKLRLVGVNLSEVTKLVRGLEEVQSQLCVTSALRLLLSHCACSFLRNESKVPFPHPLLV